MKSVLDPTFRYTPSFDTDLRRTFARIRREEKRDALATGHGPAKRLGGTAEVCALRTVFTNRHQ